MRQFILAADAAYPTALPLANGGQVCITYLEDGVETLVTDAASAAKLKRGNIIYKKVDPALGQVLFPIYKKNFSFTKGVYAAATTFSAEVTIGTVEPHKDYSLIIAKKGLLFNERNKWTSTIHTGTNPTANDTAAKLAKHINANTIGNGVTAVANGAKITITAVEKGKDYSLVPADGLMGLAVNVLSIGHPAYGDAAHVKDLFNKAAADQGIHYTYNDFDGLYPAYDFDPLKSPNVADAGFTIYTLKFAEPREMKTRDEVVNQIVQIAYPTGSAAITTMDKILDILAGGEVPAPAPEPGA